MALDSWFPVDFELPDGARIRLPRSQGTDWQIVETQGQGMALVVTGDLAERWIAAGLVGQAVFNLFEFGNNQFWAISCGSGQLLCPVTEARSPETKEEALSFALALRATRDIDKDSPLQDSLFVEKISRVLPTYSISSRTDDDVVLGYWLTGGVGVSVKSFRRLRHAMSWLGAEQLGEVVRAAGYDVIESIPGPTRGLSLPSSARPSDTQLASTCSAQPELFTLAGRPDLAAFINEHIVDIVQNRDRYGALGIGFPSATVLHGPPGCGKTYAVDRLVDFLGWPSHQVDASSVASPYIHQTSKKVAEVFDKAMQTSPSVLIIDEMEAFLADREMSSGHHRVEEVAEFLRRIPEAVEHEVLVFAMTNRLDMIDPAILRRGRFDHVVKVEYASEVEVRSLLEELLLSLPKENDIDPTPLAGELAGRPLSDVAFVVREGARLAARAGRDRLDHQSLLAAMQAAPAREREGSAKRPIGFV
jgi:cell division protease FtsH